MHKVRQDDLADAAPDHRMRSQENGQTSKSARFFFVFFNRDTAKRPMITAHCAMISASFRARLIINYGSERIQPHPDDAAGYFKIETQEVEKQTYAKTYAKN